MAMPQAGTDGESRRWHCMPGRGSAWRARALPAADIVRELRDGALRLLG